MVRKVVTVFLAITLCAGIFSVNVSAREENIYDYEIISVEYVGEDYVLESQLKYELINIGAFARKGGLKALVRVIIEGFLYTVIANIAGLRDLAGWVANFVMQTVGYMVSYKYTYTLDNGCWSPDFPSNPFCRRLV